MDSLSVLIYSSALNLSLAMGLVVICLPSAKFGDPVILSERTPSPFFLQNAEEGTPIGAFVAPDLLLDLTRRQR